MFLFCFYEFCLLYKIDKTFKKKIWKMILFVDGFSVEKGGMFFVFGQMVWTGSLRILAASC